MLPTLIECTEFPNNREEGIPDRRVAEKFTNLINIIDHLPELMEDVDDAHLNCPIEDAAVDLIKRTPLALKAGGQLRLHKITSNSKSVLSEFQLDDLAKDFKDFDLLSKNYLPVQRSLGLSWDINADTFTF